jgi:alginate O-acetyltransferase complex protein AlgI
MWFFARRSTNLLLLLFSLIFYSWGERKYTVILLFIIVFSYISGRLIHAYRKVHIKSRYLIFITAVSVNILVLAVFKFQKYFPVDIHSVVSSSFAPIAPLHLPLGISFLIFHALSYVIDVHRGTIVPQKNIINFALYMSFFPKIIAGPIIRYKQFTRQLKDRTITIKRTYAGIVRFVSGLTKKVLIANTLGVVVDQIFAIQGNLLDFSTAWFGILCYTLQIYMDFSGYTDMAIGLAGIFGFSLPENFNYPYISRSVREFWRRWHMTLTSFLRDYLYIPLGGNKAGRIRTYIHICIVFFVCGVWHGSGYTFLIWGLLHGMFLILERTRFGGFVSRLPKPFQHLYTLMVVCVGWVLFRSTSISYAGEYLRAMFSVADFRLSLHPSILLNNELLFIIPIAVCVSLNITSSIRVYLRRKFLRNFPYLVKVVDYAKIGLFMLILLLDSIVLAGETHNPFIYFRF